ncbi:MAG: hypothetical protein IJV66_01855 [Firmicutes bacterium]|nr:hypothetical protein [Bacillota bacterium]
MECAPSDGPIPMKYESPEGPLSKAQRFSPCETYPGEKRAVGRSAAKVAGL